MLNELLVAVALILVLEGIVPFLSPESVRKALLSMAGLDDRTLRFVGLTSMVVGCLLLYVLK